MPITRFARFGLGSLPAGLEPSTLPGHEGDVVNTTSSTITYNGVNYPPGYGTAAWYDPANANVNDPNNSASDEWAWNQNHGHDAATLADMLTWPKQGTGYVDHTGAVWAANVYGATLDILRLGSQPYNAQVSQNWNTLASQIYAKWGMNDWAGVVAGDQTATAKWIQASQDAATTQAAGSSAPARYLVGGQTVDASGKAVASTDPYYYNAAQDVARQLAMSGGGGDTPPALLPGGGGPAIGTDDVGGADVGGAPSLLSSPWLLGAVAIGAAVLLGRRRGR